MKGDDDKNGLFESVGKAADKISETSVGKRVGAVVTILLLAVLSGGANLTVLDQYFNGDDDGPVGGCMQHDATNYNSKATFDDGSCNFLVIIYGCTNSEAENYNSQATHDDGRCIVDIPPPVNETVYGCMDTVANNYNDKATDDDGSCDYEDEYEEPECNLTEVLFWKGWQDEDGNATGYSLGDTDEIKDGISIYTDIDSNCGEIEVTVYLDVMTFHDVDGDGVYEEEEGDEYHYFTKEFNFTIEDAVWDDHWLNMSYEELNETSGDYEAYVFLVADIDGDGEREFYEYMYIPEIKVEQ